MKKLRNGELESEEQNYTLFQNTILHNILGYTEEQIKSQQTISGSLHTPDYTLKSTSGSILAQVEAKGSKTDLQRGKDKSALQQVWRYIINTPHVDYGICTNYAKFILVSKNETIHNIQSFNFTDIEDNEDKLKEFIWLFHDIIINKSVDAHHAHSTKYDKEITDAFYDIYHNTRLMLIQEFVEHYEDKETARRRALGLAQVFLNRLMFIFFAEDMGLADRYLQERVLRSARNSTDQTSKVCNEILDLFDAYASGSKDLNICNFNGKLFSEKHDRNIVFADKRSDGYWTVHLAKIRTRNEVSNIAGLSGIVKNIIRMSEYNFKTEINVDILGQIFERSISDIGRLTETSDDERKRGGIYYTPPQITAKICRQTILPYLSHTGTAETVGDILTEYSEDISALERRLASVHILDPACGSGAFLVGAVDILLEIHKAVHDELKKRNVQSLDPWIKESKVSEIILSNIHGVDLNEESVGLTKLSMFLKTAQRGQKLPDLDDTIKSGNSLVRNREVVSSAFDWDVEFADILNMGGFGIIIGNPPYVRQESLQYKDAMQLPQPNDLGITHHIITSRADLYVYFFYHSLNLLKDNGRLGFITSDSWLFVNYAQDLQRTIKSYTKIISLERPDSAVFADPDVRTVMTFLERTDKSPAGHMVGIASGPDCTDYIKQSDMIPGKWLQYFEDFIPETTIKMVELSQIAKVWRGKTTGHNDFFVLDEGIVEKYDIDDKYLIGALKRSVEGAVLRSAPHYLLHVTDSKGTLLDTPEGKRVLEYLKLGDDMVVPKKGTDTNPIRIRDKPSVRTHRPYWYSLKKPPAPPIIMSRFADERISVYENKGEIIPADNFACVKPKKPAHTDALLAYLSSSWFALQSENMGRKAGGGALQLVISDFKTAYVPDFTKADPAALEKAWLKYREDLDSEELDRVVFAFLGFTAAQSETMQAILKDMIEKRKGAAKLKV